MTQTELLPDNRYKSMTEHLENIKHNVKFASRMAEKAVQELGVAMEWLKAVEDETASAASIEVRICLGHALDRLRDVTLQLDNEVGALLMATNQSRVSSMKVGHLVDAVEAAVERYRC